MNLNEFLSMGGYGLYVWGSYALFVVIFALNVIYPILLKRQVIRDLLRKQKMAARRQQGKSV